MSVLEQKNTKKKSVEIIIFPTEFESNSNKKEYKFEAIWNNAIYAKVSDSSPPLVLYNLVSWKEKL